ncbi:MAG: enoyl-CoA hydratase/isomerase family protein [Burkholderiaceae bacterium]
MSNLEIVRRDAAVLHIRLNRPEKRNALSSDLIEELHGVLDAVQEDTLRLFVLEGNGKNFSAGFDFTGIQDEPHAQTCWRFVRIQQLLERLGRSRVLTVALAHGRNFGAGADLFAACNWRVCTPDATFRMPGLKFGLVLGSTRLAALVGTQRATCILDSSETFDAASAHDMGFATRLVGRDDWPGVIAAALDVSENLSSTARGMLYEALSGGQDYDRDMALLVRSLLVPGLKERIQGYLA